MMVADYSDGLLCPNGRSPKGQKLTETDALGHVTTFTYDDNGNTLTESRTGTVNATSVVETTRYT